MQGASTPSVYRVATFNLVFRPLSSTPGTWLLLGICLSRLVFALLPVASCASPFSVCCVMWLGRADLEGGAGGIETGMVVGIGLGLF